MCSISCSHNKSGLKKRKSITDETVQRFDREEYDCVVIKIGSFTHDYHNWDHFGDVLDFDMVDQYLRDVKECASR